MKAYGGVDVYIHVYLISVLAGGEWSASRPMPLYPRGKLLIALIDYSVKFKNY
jgi:hypothetical protein